MPVVADIGIRNIGWQVFLEPPAVGFLHGARAKEHKVILGKTRDCQIPVKLALWCQHRGQRQAAGFWNISRQRAVKVGARTRAFEFMLGEIGNFNSAHSCLHRLDFAFYIGERAVALECWVFVCIVWPISKPLRVLKAETLVHQRAFCHKTII